MTLTPETMYLTMQERLPILREGPDAWLRRMMAWHFGRETGAPYWLRRRETLKFDPVRDVKTMADLALFGYYEPADLRSVPSRDLVPRGFAKRPRRVFETGGSSGPPCRIVDVTTGEYNRVLYATMLEARGLGGRDAIAMVPSGPHAYGTFVARLMDGWHGQAHFIDFDPRWVKHLLREGQTATSYVDHLVEQTLGLLRTQRAGLLFTTSKLLMELVLRLPAPLAELGVEAVCTGGTSCTPEEERWLREEHLRQVQWIDTYGNTLMGHALQADAVAGAPSRSYHLPPPLAFIRVVRPDSPETEVAEGERGRVLLQTLLEDLFVPNLLERDTAVRTGPHPWFPWPGVRAPGPFGEGPTQNAVEGVY
jgi:hypothetical protein